MMEPLDSHGSSRHNASILSGIDRGSVTVRWKVVVDARAAVVEESPQGLRDVAVLSVSQGVVPIDDRHAPRPVNPSQLAFSPGGCEPHLEWWPPRGRHAGALPPTPRRPTTAPLPTGRRP